MLLTTVSEEKLIKMSKNNNKYRFSHNSIFVIFFPLPNQKYKKQLLTWYFQLHNLKNLPGALHVKYTVLRPCLLSRKLKLIELKCFCNEAKSILNHTSSVVTTGLLHKRLCNCSTRILPNCCNYLLIKSLV